MMRGEIPSRHRQSFGHRRLAKNPSLARKLKQMALPLAPLVQMTTGAVHPAFPKTVLQFWLLTNEDLESLARFYHQHTPCQWTAHYPCPITWSSDLPVEEKRRQIGKFIGLRGCESPVLLKTRDEIEDELQNEIMAKVRQARLAAADEEMLRKKQFP